MSLTHPPAGGQVVLERRLTGLRGCDLLRGALRGIEKESLRVTADGCIAATPHPRALGSALTNRFITTDFSEALLEFITPPLADLRGALQFLCDLHQFTCRRIGDELLWAMSMPCRIRGEEDIPIARYGDSNVGRMKTIYRRGLSYRYGRYMQAIAGLHYNFSLPEAFWPEYQALCGDRSPLPEFRSAAYLGLVRNVRRMGWFLMYLFGASPAICRSFLKGGSAGLERLDDGTVYAPWATSLRMGDLGYHNAEQQRLRVSANSLDEYIADLESAIRTENPAYRKIGVLVDGEYRQLNANELQIENEFYSTVRPKRVARSGERPTLALRRGGVQYVELRILDINPFEPIGINRRQARFVEAFLLYCLLAESPPIADDEEAENRHNQALVAQRGRAPGLELARAGGRCRLRDWAAEIFAAVAAVCELLAASGHPEYREACARYADWVAEPEATLSARLLAELRASGEPLASFGLRLSRDYSDYFRELGDEVNARLPLLLAEAEDSHRRQAEIEAGDRLSFEEYLAQYYA